MYLFYLKMKNRITRTLDSQQPPEQAGFRKGFSTLDHILVLNELVRRAQDYSFPVYLLFIDYEKAFDSVKTSAILESMRELGIENCYIVMWKCIYRESKAVVKIGKEERIIELKKRCKTRRPRITKVIHGSIRVYF